MRKLLGQLLCASLVLLAGAVDASPHRRRTRHRRASHHRPAPHRPVPRRPAPRRPTAPRAVAPTPTPSPPPTPAPSIEPAAGCRLGSAVTRGVTEGTLTVDGVERSYLLSVPERYDPAGAPVPLVFAYHGLTGTPTSLRSYLRVEREAAGAAIFVYPAGVREASRRHPQGSTRWDVRAEGRDVAFFDALLARLSGTHCVDARRVFVVGHSAGAVMTNAIGCARGASIRAIAPIAGMWAGRRCADAPAVLVVHGRADGDVAFHYGEDTRDRWIAAAACGAEPVAVEGSPCVRYGGCAGRGAVEFCTHEGNHGVPAPMAHEVWRFFASYARR